MCKIITGGGKDAKLYDIQSLTLKVVYSRPVSDYTSGHTVSAVAYDKVWDCVYVGYEDGTVCIFTRKGKVAACSIQIQYEMDQLSLACV
jgi:hypothetical protein